MAEIENLFLLPEVVKVAAEKFCLPRDYEQIMNDVKEKGLLRMEGKEYIMQDGDIVLFRFNV